LIYGNFRFEQARQNLANVTFKLSLVLEGLIYLGLIQLFTIIIFSESGFLHPTRNLKPLKAFVRIYHVMSSIVDCRKLLNNIRYVPVSVVDPDSFQIDPDPGLGVLMTKCWKIQLKIFVHSLIKKGDFLIPRPPWNRSLQPPKKNTQRFKKCNLLRFSTFVGHFLPPWIRIRIHNTGYSSLDAFR
jgi:hypothetical protein